MAPAGHASGAPFALPDFGDEGGELAATHDLLERSDIRGKAIALDALHTVRKTARLITERCGADYVFTVKGNAPETHAILDGIDRERDAAGRFEKDVEKARGRLERRSVRVTTPPKGAISHPGASQAARVIGGKSCLVVALRNPRRHDPIRFTAGFVEFPTKCESAGSFLRILRSPQRLAARSHNANGLKLRRRPIRAPSRQFWRMPQRR